MNILLFGLLLSLLSSHAYEPSKEQISISIKSVECCESCFMNIEHFYVYKIVDDADCCYCGIPE